MTKTIGGGVTAPGGFTTAGVRCGIKKSGLDLALLVSDRPARAAAVFTTNKAVAAPIVVSREHLACGDRTARAIVVNSGCANACTGEPGLAAAREMATVTARVLDCPDEQVLVASTGVIGETLAIDRVVEGIDLAAGVLDRESHRAAAEAIMTTDKGPKESAVQVSTSAGSFVVGGMVKGAGMIEPRMATMLGFVTTDAAVDPATLQRALVEVNADTFNAISVDGEPSTNDTVFVLANGASGVTIDESSYQSLVGGLRDVCRTLAIEVVRGGEGATKLVTVRVTGAASDEDARTTARAIANSPLVKTAIHGGDPNWGRLVAVAGRAGGAFDLSKTRVLVGPHLLFADETIFGDREPAAAEHLRGREVEVAVDLGTGGPHEAVMWTCDFSAEYVHINADYRT